jgi:hypothetical protein
MHWNMLCRRRSGRALRPEVHIVEGQTCLTLEVAS